MNQKKIHRKTGKLNRRRLDETRHKKSETTSQSSSRNTISGLTNPSKKTLPRPAVYARQPFFFYLIHNVERKVEILTLWAHATLHYTSAKTLAMDFRKAVL